MDTTEDLLKEQMCLLSMAMIPTGIEPRQPWQPSRRYENSMLYGMHNTNTTSFPALDRASHFGIVALYPEA